MLDFQSLKALAKSIRRPVPQLLALAPKNDPFYMTAGRQEAAEWAAGIWETDFLGRTIHLRRGHYDLVSLPDGSLVLVPNGAPYVNTHQCWTYWSAAMRDARHCGLIPDGAIFDRRNADTLLFASPLLTDAYGQPRELHSALQTVYGEIGEMPSVEMPALPDIGLSSDFLNAQQKYHLEFWVEKSTQDDWLIPLCRARGVNLTVGKGETSETRAKELVLRCAAHGKPSVLFTLSDFDIGGRSMPKAAARKMEFVNLSRELGVPLQVIVVGLTPEQCEHYQLKEAPPKPGDNRDAKLRRIFGRGQTELDALESKYPGEMARIVNGLMDGFQDRTLAARARAVEAEAKERIAAAEREIYEEFSEDIDELETAYDAINPQIEALESRTEALFQLISEALYGVRPDLSDLEIPEPDVSGETTATVLYDSCRSYLEQVDHYNAWRDGEVDASPDADG